MEINGETLESAAGPEEFEKAARGWKYDATSNLVVVKLPDQAAEVKARIE